MNSTWEPLSEVEKTTALDAFESTYGNVLENDGPVLCPKDQKKSTKTKRVPLRKLGEKRGNVKG